MTTIPQTGTFIELDPVIGWQASSMSALSPVNPAGLVSNCSAGQPVPPPSPPSTLNCVTGQPLFPAATAAASCCPSPVTLITPNSSLFPIGLAVDCVTGQPSPFAPALANELNYPVALALGDCSRRLYLLDDAVNRVKELDLAQQREFETITGFGGKGKQIRQFRRPRGLALLDDGSYVIADTGNHQVKIFSRFPNALLAVWGSGSPGNGIAEFRSPWRVAADRCGLIYIADKGNGRVQRIHRNGAAETPITGLKTPPDWLLDPTAHWRWWTAGTFISMGRGKPRPRAPSPSRTQTASRLIRAAAISTPGLPRPWFINSKPSPAGFVRWESASPA